MFWVNFLHFYQPYNQQDDILERVVNESYRRIIGGLASNPKAKITININGGLTELLAKRGYKDVIRAIKDFAKKGQIEFTGSVKYHPFLPLLPEDEIIRQINLNEQTNKKYFGKVWKPQGFFSPELAYSKKVARIARDCGFKWIIAEELASPRKEDFTKIYTIKGLKDFKILFRDKRISVLILSAIVRNMRALIDEIGGEELKKRRYLLTVMDAETFGHHRPGLENLLFKIYQDKKIPKAFVSEIIERFSTDDEIAPRECTWSSEEQDFFLEKEKRSSFTLWKDPKNPIHTLQWEFTYFVINLVKELPKNASWYKEVREKLDKALQSDQYWWASARPWWSLEMIENGAYNLREVVFSIPDVSGKAKHKAQSYYQKIVDLAFAKQRTGAIRQAHRQAFKTLKNRPYKKRVMAGQFNSMILEFEDEMKKAAASQEFEKAIKWRDAIYKLKSGMDIYDVLHVVDDLRRARSLPSIKDYWEHKPEEFSSFAKKHFIGYRKKEFLKKQQKQLFDEIKKAYISRSKIEHPLGFSKDEYNNFYLCELPGGYIEYWLGEYGWDAMSLAKFPKTGLYHEKGQCFYEVKRGKLKITISSKGLIGRFFNFLKRNDIHKGKFMRLGILAESTGWSVVFFERVRGRLSVTIPYRASKEGMGFKFKFLGVSEFTGKQTKKSKKCNFKE